jgi:hypothetical protein
MNLVTIDSPGLTRIACNEQGDANIKYIIIPIRWDQVTELSETFQVVRLTRTLRNHSHSLQFIVLNENVQFFG